MEVLQKFVGVGRVVQTGQGQLIDQDWQDQGSIWGVLTHFPHRTLRGYDGGINSGELPRGDHDLYQVIEKVDEVRKVVV